MNVKPVPLHPARPGEQGAYPGQAAGTGVGRRRRTHGGAVHTGSIPTTCRKSRSRSTSSWSASRRSGAPKGLIIIDTMRTAFQQDSNDEKEMLATADPVEAHRQEDGLGIIVLHHNAKYSNRYSGNTAFAGVLDYLWNWTRDGYTAELSLEGRDDAVQPLCFEFDLDEQRNVFQGTKGESMAADRQESPTLTSARCCGTCPTRPTAYRGSGHGAFGLKKWRCRELLGKAVNAKYAVKVGVGNIGNPSTYYRTQAGKTLVDKYAGKLLVG